MKTKQKKNTLALIFGIILILCISVVGVLICRNTDLSASADTNTDSGENVNAPQFDVIDYQGNKVYATYQFVKLNETDCSVRITNKTLATTANIPSEGIIDGKKYVVTEIASNGFMSSTKLKVVKLSHSIKKIGNMAFANCSQLQYVDLFNVEELGNSVFYKCTNLETIVIPNSVKEVGSYVFRNNNTQIEIRATEQLCLSWNNSWNANNSNQDVHYESKYKRNMQADIVYNDSARSGNLIKGFMITNGTSNLSDIALLDPFEPNQENNIIIPSAYQYTDGECYPILAIARHAFENSSFDNLIIEYSTTELSIGFNAFEFTTSESGTEMNVIINRPITFIDIEEEEVSDNIFVGSALENIILPENCDIASNMFTGCENLKNVLFETPQYYGVNEVDKLLEKLGNLLNSSNGIVNITEKTESIGESAFDSATAIKELHLSSKIKNVGATILENWDKGNQKVVLHNETPIKLKINDVPENEGWHSQWNSNFNNIKYDYYDIKFDTGEFQNNISDMHVESGKPIGELPNFDAGQYKELRGWYLDSELITEETIYNFETDIVVSAKVSEFCNIVFDTNNGTGIKHEMKHFLEDEMPTIDTPRAEHRSFIGYYDDDKGEGNLYFDSKMNSVREIIAGEIKLYAIYKPIMYTIYYDLRGFSDYSDFQFSATNDTRNKLSITYFETVTLYDAYSEDFVFAGWYLNGKRVDILKEIDRNITLTAKWRGLYVNPAPNGTLNDDSPTVVFGFSRIIMGATYRINIGPNVKELYILANVRKPVDITMSIVVMDKIVGPSGFVLSKRTSNLKLTIRNINIKAVSGSHAIVMDSEKSLLLYSYDSSITGSDTLSPKYDTLTTQQGSSAIYCKNLVLYTSVTLRGGSNATMSGKPFVGGVAVSLISGGKIYLQSDGIKIIGGDCVSPMGYAGCAVYSKGQYEIVYREHYSVQIDYGAGTKPNLITNPPYVGY